MANGLITAPGASLVPQISQLGQGFALGRQLAAQKEDRDIRRQQMEQQELASQQQSIENQQSRQLAGTALGLPNKQGQVPTQSSSQQAMAQLIIRNPEFGDKIQKQIGLNTKKKKTEAIQFASLLSSTPFEDRPALIERRARALESQSDRNAEHTRSLLDDSEEEQNQALMAVMISGLPIEKQLEIMRGDKEFSKFIQTESGGLVGITKTGQSEDINLPSGVKLAGKKPLVQIGDGEKSLKLLEAKLKNAKTEKQIEKLEQQIEAKQVEIGQEKEQAKFDANESLVTFDNTISTIDRMLKGNSLESATGFQSAFPTLPGSDAAGFEADLETLKSQVFLSQVEKLRGLGALSENEGKKLAAAIGALDLKVGDKKLRSELERIKRELFSARNRWESKVNRTFGQNNGAANTSPQQAPLDPNMSDEDLLNF